MANVCMEDDSDHDVDFVAQAIVRNGIQVKLDRWNIGAGRRLWDEIDSFITDPTQSDAWAIYATQNSLSSEACREELAYALDRALRDRGKTFPLIALFPATVDRDLIPSCISTRLHISLVDPEWKERIVAAVEQREPNIARKNLDPYSIHQHAAIGPFTAVFEVRPRAGVWCPFIAAIPIAEKTKLG